MKYPTHKTQTVNASIVDGKSYVTVQITVDTRRTLDELALARQITRAGLAREILTRIAERPDLLVAVLPERR